MAAGVLTDRDGGAIVVWEISRGEDLVRVLDEHSRWLEALRGPLLTRMWLDRRGSSVRRAGVRPRRTLSQSVGGL